MGASGEAGLLPKVKEASPGFRGSVPLGQDTILSDVLREKLATSPKENQAGTIGLPEPVRPMILF